MIMQIPARKDIKVFRILTIVILMLQHAPTQARDTQCDSVLNVGDVAIQPEEKGPAEKTFSAKQLLLPLSLTAVGTFAVYNGWCREVCEDVNSEMSHMRGSRYFHFDDYIQYAPAVGFFGLGFTGVKTKHTFRQRVAVEITSYLAMAALVNAMKYSIRERRPDSGARNSFPSGHTATAFTGAELIREEYGNWWGAGAYTVATGVAFLRLYNGRHWLNDVIAGAGIGILSARIGYWMLPLYNKWFHWDKKPNKAIVSMMPSYNPAEKSANLSLYVAF